MHTTGPLVATTHSGADLDSLTREAVRLSQRDTAACCVTTARVGAACVGGILGGILYIIPIHG